MANTTSFIATYLLFEIAKDFQSPTISFLLYDNETLKNQHNIEIFRVVHENVKITNRFDNTKAYFPID